MYLNFEMYLDALFSEHTEDLLSYVWYQNQDKLDQD